MSEQPKQALEPGQSFGRYVIESLLGVGGMGAVYRARDSQLGRVVALKVVRAGRKDSSGVEPEVRLLSEARSVAALRHPNVVAVFDAGVIDGQTFVSMEFVEGRTLRAFVGDGSISLEDRRRWLVEVAEALAAAHRAGIVHRDVKPENVLISTDGHARVLDFGIAKRVTFDTTAPTSDGIAPQTLEGRVVGTISYMAPEQLAGAEASAAWDQFSWGVMAYELLTGKHPRQTVAIPGPTAHLSQTPSLPNELEPRLTFNDVAAITLAMSSDPSRRFASMTDLVAAWRQERPPPGDREPRVAAAERGGGRWRYALAAFAMLVAGVAMGSVVHRGSRTVPVPVAITSTPPSASALVVGPVAMAPPSIASAVASSPAPPASSHFASSQRPSPTQREDYDTSCQCMVNTEVLCRPGVDFHMRDCQCVGTATYFPDRSATSWHYKVRDAVEGTPCRGWDSNGKEGDGTLTSCLPGCATIVSGIHRSACRGIRSPTGQEIEGFLLCYNQ